MIISNLSETPIKPQLRTPLLIGQNNTILIYQIQWKSSNNSNSFDFDHYRIQYGDGNDFESITVIKTSVIISFKNGSVSYVRVAVINRCGQESEYDAKPIPVYKIPNLEKSQGVNITAAVISVLSVLLVFAVAVALILGLKLTQKLKPHTNTEDIQAQDRVASL